jgi:hypothetical protein
VHAIGQAKFDYNKWLILLSVIPLSGGHCNVLSKRKAWKRSDDHVFGLKFVWQPSESIVVEPQSVRDGVDIHSRVRFGYLNMMVWLWQIFCYNHGCLIKYCSSQRWPKRWPKILVLLHFNKFLPESRLHFVQFKLRLIMS